MRTIIAAVSVLMLTAPALAAPQNTNTPADTIHPNIHEKVGQGDGANANPNGNGNGGQIHGIGNVPGQAGTNPNDDGTAGFSNELGNVHGGIGTVNRNVD